MAVTRPSVRPPVIRLAPCPQFKFWGASPPNPHASFKPSTSAPLWRTATDIAPKTRLESALQSSGSRLFQTLTIKSRFTQVTCHLPANSTITRDDRQWRARAPNSGGVQISIYSGQVFRGEAGHRSDRYPASRLRTAGLLSGSATSASRCLIQRRGGRDADEERADHVADTTDAAARPRRRDLLEIIENRNEARSVIVTSSSPSTAGTRSSASRPPPTQSSTAWSTTPTASSSTATACEKSGPPGRPRPPQLDRRRQLEDHP